MAGPRICCARRLSIVWRRLQEKRCCCVLLALRQTGLLGKKKFVGFDTSPTLLAALARGQINGLVAQNPTKMGYLGVTAAVQHLRGETVAPAIDTGCVLVTPENRQSPEVIAVVGP